MYLLKTKLVAIFSNLMHLSSVTLYVKVVSNSPFAVCFQLIARTNVSFAAVYLHFQNSPFSGSLFRTVSIGIGHQYGPKKIRGGSFDTHSPHSWYDCKQNPLLANKDCNSKLSRSRRSRTRSKPKPASRERKRST